MDSIIRGLVTYFFLLLIFRVSGKRTLSQTSNFEFVLLLIIAETTQQAMIDNDHSITNAFLLIMTLIGTTIALSFIKMKFHIVEKWLEGTPLVIIENGKMYRDRMRRERIDEADILLAARSLQGLERLDQIKHAVVEQSGEITIIPKNKTGE